MGGLRPGAGSALLKVVPLRVGTAWDNWITEGMRISAANAGKEQDWHALQVGHCVAA